MMLYKQNNTTEEPEGLSFTLHILDYYVRPVYTTIGIFANLVAAILLRTNDKSRSSTTVYCRCITTVHFIFLITVLLAWIDNQTPLSVFSQVSVACQTFFFFSNLTNFVSVWTQVVIAIDAHIRMCYTARAALCSRMRARFVLLGIIAVAIAVHVNLSLTVSNHTMTCIPLADYGDSTLLLVRFDAIFNVVLPYAVVIILDSMTMVVTIKHRHRGIASFVHHLHVRMSTVATRRYSPRHEEIVIRRDVILSLAINGVFLVFTSPTQFLRFYTVTRTTNVEPTMILYLILQMALHAYHLAFTLHAFVYILYLPYMRHALNPANLKRNSSTKRKKSSCNYRRTKIEEEAI